VCAGPDASVDIGDSLRLTTDRATSYWNEYYRQRFWSRDEYPAFRAIATLTRWLSSDTVA